jgi:hypothetical protein
MKQFTCLLLTASLMLIGMTLSQAQDVDFDPLHASDVNADGIVNILDLTFVATYFGETPIGNQPSAPDANKDGTVDILDLTLVASHFGKKSGIPFEVTDATFDAIVLGSELPIVVEFKDDT